jgi:putative ABC transport system permease protein
MFETLASDLKYSVRKMFKNRVFTLIVISTMSLAIGMNTAIFSVINALLLDSLPYSKPHELVQVQDNVKALNLEKMPVSALEFSDFQKQTQIFSQVGIYSSWEVNLGSLRGSDAQRLPAAQVSGSLFDVLGVRPELGRFLRPEDNNAGASPVAVVTYGFWQQRFNKDTGVIGQMLILDGINYTIVGVMPKGFYFPDRDTQLWAPVSFTPGDFSEANRGSRSYSLYARLKPGLNVEQARAGMQSFANQLAQVHPEAYPRTFYITIDSLQEVMVGDARRPLIILLLAAVMVLLVACVNVANLMGVRATTWRREVDVRIALGASRARMFVQFLTESLLLSFIAGALGIVIANVAKGVILSTVAAGIAHPDDVATDGPVLAFTLVVCLITGIVFGLTPAFQIYKTRLYDSLRESTSTTSSRKRRSLDFLIVAEVCLSLVLLISAGIMIKSLYKLQTVETGFNPNNVLTMKLYLPVNKYGDTQRADFYTELLRRVASHPGVQAAGVINQLPLSGGATDRTFFIEGKQGESAQPDFQIRHINADYFKAMGINVIEGRSFAPTDDRNAPKVLIINQALAKKYFSGEDPVGKRMAYFAPPGQAPEWRQIVGVVNNVRHFGLNAESQPEVYVPYLQHPRAFMNLVVRTSADPLGLASTIRRDVQDMDRNQAVYDIKTMDSVVNDSIKMQRFSAMLLGAFAGFALFLAAIGLYGVLAYSVSQRTQELGLRMALGAQKSHVLKLVVNKAMALVLIGVSLGLAGAFAGTRLLSSVIYGVSTTDPFIFTMVSLVLIIVSVIACLIPAVSALKVDPVVALKYE